jgi:hypothetical protein
MKKGGASLAGPIWNKFMNEALKTLPDEKFEKPDLSVDVELVKPVLRGFWQGNENFFIDKISGKLANKNTPRETIEEKVVTNVHSILYWVNKNDIMGAPPVNPSSDPQFNHFEIPIQNWWTQNKNKYPITTWADRPTNTDDVHINEIKPRVSILEPDSGTVYPSSKKMTVQVSTSGTYPIIKTEVFINDNYFGSFDANTSISFTPSLVGNIQAENKLTLVVHDSIYNTAEVSTMFKVKQ